MTTAVAALILLGSASSARAEERDTARARALFEAAGRLEREARWAAAQDRLREALRLRETPQLHFALGWALENDDKLLEAKTAYETAARLGRARAGAEEARRLALARLADLTAMTPVVRVRLAGAVAHPDVRVLVDGREIARSGNIATTQVNPGSHVVRVERGASEAIEQVVYLGRRSDRTLVLDASALAGTREAAIDRRSEPVAPQPVRLRDVTADHDAVVPWLVLSGGVALMVGGGALLASAAGDSNSTARQTVGLAMGGLGIVGATAGGALLLWRAGGDGTKPTARATAGAAPVPGGLVSSATIAF